MHEHGVPESIYREYFKVSPVPDSIYGFGNILQNGGPGI